MPNIWKAKLKVFKKVLALFLTLLSGWAIERLCHKATDGFQISHIRSTEECHFGPGFETGKNEILSQKFHYLGKGAQSYVFVSEDGEYILKFFKFQHLSLPPLLKYLPLSGQLSALREEKMQRREMRKEQVFASYKLAFQELKEESGLILTHFSGTPALNCTITLLDRLNIKHIIQADEVEFVLQKRAELVLPTLKGYLKNGEMLKARDALSSLLNLAKLCFQKGVYDKDAHLTKNFGFIGNKAVLIDCGSLSRSSLEKAPKIKAGALEAWLSDESLELLKAFQEMRSAD